MVEGDGQGVASGQGPMPPVPAEVLVTVQVAAMVRAMEARLRARVEEMVRRELLALLRPVLESFEKAFYKLLDS